jgi:hypothetical protein
VFVGRATGTNTSVEMAIAWRAAAKWKPANMARPSVRTRPLSHAAFVAAFRTWVRSDGACP